MITQERLRELFDYEPETGRLRRKKLTHNRHIEYPGFKDTTGRSMRLTIDWESWLYHRAVWYWHYGTLPKFIDHRDRDPLNNRIKNLRECSKSQNGANSNRRGRYLKGVTRLSRDVPRPWRARITVEYRNIYLGLFATEQEAHEAYVEAAKTYHGEFACAG